MVAVRARNVSVGDANVIVNGIWATLTSWLPTTPSTVARNVALPALTAVTVPVTASMVATGEFDDDHCTVTPDIGEPLPSKAVAVSLIVEPSDPMVDGPVTVTVAGLRGSVELPQLAITTAVEHQINDLLTLPRYPATRESVIASR